MYTFLINFKERPISLRDQGLVSSVLSAPLFLLRGCLEQTGPWHPVCGLKEAQLFALRTKKMPCALTLVVDTLPHLSPDILFLFLSLLILL